MRLEERLKAAREKAGLKPSEAARKLDVHLPQLSAWEKGNMTPRIEALIKMAKAYNVSLDELVGNKTA